MKILVTGGYGFVGSALVAKLARNNHHVFAFGHPPRNQAVLHQLPGNVEHRTGALLDLTDTELSGLDAVVHLAGGGGAGKCKKDPTTAIRTNVTGTARLAQKAHRAGVKRLLFASTVAVYGTSRAPKTGPYSETLPPAPEDIYGAVKEAAEEAWSAVGGTSLRLANIYGTGIGVDMGLHGAMERFARAAATGGELTVYGTGSQRIDYIHIDDLCQAIELALMAPSLPPALNLGGGEPCTIRSIANIAIAAGRQLGQEPQLIEKPAPADKVWPDRSLSIELARELLSWKPQTTMEQGITKLVQMMAKET